MSRLWSSDPATNTLSPQTIGELVPTLGILTFQAMFSPFAPSHVVGAFEWPAMPFPYGPRNAGHEWSGGGSTLTAAAAGGFSGSTGFFASAVVAGALVSSD